MCVLVRFTSQQLNSEAPYYAIALIESLKDKIKSLDNTTNLPVLSVSRCIYWGYMKSGYLNYFRRKRDYVKAYIVSRIWKESKKLHLGCGFDHFPKYINSDFIKTPATDYVLDARSLPFPDSSVIKIESYHMVEHVSKNSAIEMFAEWHRVLEDNGKLIIELPDFDNVIREYLNENDDEREKLLLKYIFGSQRFDSDFHYWGWNFERLENELHNQGFKNIERKDATDNHTDEAPCLRVEAEVLDDPQ